MVLGVSVGIQKTNHDIMIPVMLHEVVLRIRRFCDEIAVPRRLSVESEHEFTCAFSEAVNPETETWNLVSIRSSSDVCFATGFDMKRTGLRTAQEHWLMDEGHLD